mmetsp:Transcript_26080/g.49249  ORF Transcript_26080/g.49249 Transcript_26080/m.49249 type:complete len:299 (-) Transcript_26080:587-1483(-)
MSRVQSPAVVVHAREPHQRLQGCHENAAKRHKHFPHHQAGVQPRVGVARSPLSPLHLGPRVVAVLPRLRAQRVAHHRRRTRGVLGGARGRGSVLGLGLALKHVSVWTQNYGRVLAGPLLYGVAQGVVREHHDGLLQLLPRHRARDGLAPLLAALDPVGNGFALVGLAGGHNHGVAHQLCGDGAEVMRRRACPARNPLHVHRAPCSSLLPPGGGPRARGAVHRHEGGAGSVGRAARPRPSLVFANQRRRRLQVGCFRRLGLVCDERGVLRMVGVGRHGCLHHHVEHLQPLPVAQRGSLR